MFAVLAAAFVKGASSALLKDYEYNALLSFSDHMKWVPGLNPMFAGMSDAEYDRRLMISIEPFSSNGAYTRLTPTVSIPKNYIFGVDGEKSCQGLVEDQASCGSCWAFSGVGQFGERRCAADSKKENKRFSPQYVVSCDPTDMGCDGGWLNAVNHYLVRTGTVEWSCVDYFSGATGEGGSCPAKCDDGTTVIDESKIYKAKSDKNYGRDMTSMMTAIHKDGPLQVGFTVYSDFSYYDTGIYHHVYGYARGGHAVTIIGWGEDPKDGTLYWVVRNSWGPGWGETIEGNKRNGKNAGYFRILRGNNECGIENEAWGSMF